MPLQITPEVAPVTSTIKITQILNDTMNGNMMIRYNELDTNGNVLHKKDIRIKGIESIRILYNDIATEIVSGLTFEEASKKVLYSQIANGTLI